MNERGIIIAPVSSVSINSDGNCIDWKPIDPIFLRQYALYWDVIECPEDIIGGDLISHGHPDIQLLEQEKIFRTIRGQILFEDKGKWKLSFFGENPVEFVVAAQLFLRVKHEETDTHWTIGQSFSKVTHPNFLYKKCAFIAGGKAISIPGNLGELATILTEQGSSLEIRLYDVLPVPGPNVPIDIVLEFKKKRQDELNHLREALDKLYKDILNSSETSLSLDKAVEYLQLALIDLNKVANESRIDQNRGSLQPILDITTAISAGFLGWLAGKPYGIKLSLIAAAFGMAPPIIEFVKNSSSRIPKTKVPNEYKDYQYVFHALKGFEV